MYLVQHPRTQPNHGPKKRGGVRSQTGRRTLPRRSLLPEESPYGPESKTSDPSVRVLKLNTPSESSGSKGKRAKRCGKCRAPVTCPGAALAGLVCQHRPEGHVGQWPPKWHPHWARLEAGRRWGHGGMGKTTFLQHVYEDEMTEEI
ncbi:hypothetical protein IEQ34_000969 [Dendrobium chrysotoxum]|uniref:Uncharacterized protein n=1 Tax=Dendrobium chrysotoxum TaxID=161865 RepID=A0AAV7HK39_DENCH|nr:hypothetical protein IEQ34_000969 [Dendrobium chrysotoxum]